MTASGQYRRKECPQRTDFVAEVGCDASGRWACLRAALGSAGPDAFYATSTLRGAQSLSGWWSRDQRCKPPQVLGDGG
jgi:hypothetical protein